MPLLIGQVLRERYQIQDQLGQGGFGIVYRALDLHLNRVCAVKENLDASPDAQQQFRMEAQLLARLRHRHLPQVIDFFIEANGQQYLVMEFIAGEDLQSLVMRVGRLSEARVLYWAFQILDALAYLHSQAPPVIHRDIKPANIRITPDGNACLVDFGIAKVAFSGVFTTTAARGVTPGYSPPEQYSGGTDARSDMYALGATLYFALTGFAPPDAMARAVNQTAVLEPKFYVPNLAPSLNAAIMRALELRAEQRFYIAREMEDALRVRVAATQTIGTLQPYTNVVRRPGQIPFWGIVLAFMGGISATLLIVWLVLKQGFVSTPSLASATVVAIAPPPTFFATNTLVPTWTATSIPATATRETIAPTQTPIPPSATLLPTATPSPSPTLVPTFTPIPLPKTIFQETFSNLDAATWNFNSNAGSVQVRGDVLGLSSSSTSYPYVTTRSNPFPVNHDFRAVFDFGYVRTGSCGVGIVMTSYELPWGMSSASANLFQENAERTGMAAGVFDYDDGLRVIYRSGADRRDFRYPKPDRFIHQLTLTFQNERYTISFDDVEIYRSPTTTARANFVWIGHPARLDARCEWDTLQVDSIRIDQLP